MIWDPSDANPLHRRLPAEIVSRRTREVVKKGPTLPKEREDDVVIVDQKTAITLKPDARPKWLNKACKLTQDGKASATELYNIVVSRRFSSGLPERIGKKLGMIVQKNLSLFSDKQRRHLSSNEFQLNVHMVAASAGDLDEDADVDDAPKDEAEVSASNALLKEQALLEGKQREAEMAAQEADRAARLVEEVARRNRREAERREERKAFQFENESVSRHAAEKEAAQKRKLEEEADALLERALVPVPRERADDNEKRRGRSRSIEARSDSPPRRRRTEWRQKRPEALTGSRAILLNRDFQEDLPHLPRPNQQGPQRSSMSFVPDERSRSRARSRRRRR